MTALFNSYKRGRVGIFYCENERIIKVIPKNRLSS